MMDVVVYPDPVSITVTPVICPALLIRTVSTAGVAQSPVTVAIGGTVYPEPALAMFTLTTPRA